MRRRENQRAPKQPPATPRKPVTTLGFGDARQKIEAKIPRKSEQPLASPTTYDMASPNTKKLFCVTPAFRSHPLQCPHARIANRPRRWSFIAIYRPGTKIHRRGFQQREDVGWILAVNVHRRRGRAS